MVGAITALVGTAGHQVITSYDGDTAIRRFEEEAPDLVLLDLAMPGRDGVDVCREIRRTSRTPIIVLTGEADELAKVEALDAGADDYVTKPFGKQELLARIRAVMAPPRGRRRDARWRARRIAHPRHRPLTRRRSRAWRWPSPAPSSPCSPRWRPRAAGWSPTNGSSPPAGRTTRTPIRSG